MTSGRDNDGRLLSNTLSAFKTRASHFLGSCDGLISKVRWRTIIVVNSYSLRSLLYSVANVISVEFFIHFLKCLEDLSRFDMFR